MHHWLLVLPLLAASALAQPQHRLGDILVYTDSVVSAMPSGTSQNDYQVPSGAYLNAFKTVVGNILSGHDSLAAAQAASLSYRVVLFTDTSVGTWPSMQQFFVLEKLPNASNYWGTYVFAVSPVRPQLVIQAPHPLNDSRTGLQSVYVFRTIGARGFFLAGTHRCNSAVFSPCDGTTSTCGTTEPYRESDVAHSVTSPFYYATVALEEFAPLTVVQLHGFAKLSTDPYLIMSNSTAASPAVDRLAQLRDALLSVDNSLTFKIAHLDQSWTRLTGTTNVEGRLINGSSDPCDLASPGNSGRFLHIEQAYGGLRDDPTGWQKMATALAAVYAPTTTVERTPDVPEGFQLSHNYPNPFNPSTTIEFTLPRGATILLDVVSITGQVVATCAAGFREAGTHRTQWKAEAAAGTYFARLRVTNPENGRLEAQLVRKLVLTK